MLCFQYYTNESYRYTSVCVSVVTSFPVCPRLCVSSPYCGCSTSATTSYRSSLLPYTGLHISGNWYVPDGSLTPPCHRVRFSHANYNCPGHIWYLLQIMLVRAGSNFSSHCSLVLITWNGWNVYALAIKIYSCIFLTMAF